MVKDLKPVEFAAFCIGTSLAMMNAGCTNAIGMIGLSATLSHMTGVSTRIGTTAALGNWLQWSVDVITLTCFTGGCLIASLIISSKGKYNLNWRFSLTLIMEGLCLVYVALFSSFDQPAFLSKSVVTFAMGLQNGMTSIWSGGVGRSTHVTGFIADTGIIFGFWAVDFSKSDFWKLPYIIPFYLCFIFGAFLGGQFWKSLGRQAFLVPASVCFFTAIVFEIRSQLKYKKKPAKIDEKETTELQTTISSEAGAAQAALEEVKPIHDASSSSPSSSSPLASQHVVVDIPTSNTSPSNVT